ncbi:helix-hairpin-helix domain-containing protein [Candidatus Woesebacteria bacterium]|nr:helix-hairpin-helix domain-containing protein [Candidatus Woesebacteria bacterium]
MFEQSDKFSVLIKQIKQNLSVWLVIQIIIFLSGSSSIIFGLYKLFSESQIIEESESACELDPEFGVITVDIGGAVNNPGVYELKLGSRINDLISVSNGFSDTVDKYHINKVLNLSKRLEDGEKIYIPTIEESKQVADKSQNNSTSQNELASAEKIISINTSSKESLMGLEGIGEKRADDIISGRPYSALNDLLTKEIVTNTIYENIKNSISL